MGLWVDDMVQGKIDVPDNMLRVQRNGATKSHHQQYWDYHEDVEREKSLGLMGKIKMDMKEATSNFEALDMLDSAHKK